MLIWFKDGLELVQRKTAETICFLRMWDELTEGRGRLGGIPVLVSR